jgi:nitroimidazol reductase NimA-like FMN-containing flavoprotein (pyridoxamine 5'-phosphate oxidase superfamily)
MPPQRAERRAASGHARFEVLDRAECLRLLGATTTGRIAITVRALPVIVPVQFTVAGDRILLRASYGSALAAATDRTIVAFEADGVDEADRSMWSVAATGRAEHVSDDDAAPEVLPSWSVGHEDQLVSVTTDHLDGRRGWPDGP